GGRDVLRLYGYSEQKPDGLYFPDSQSEPDIPQVASVTVDVMLLRAELNLVLLETHPNPQVLQELMDQGLQVNQTADAGSLNPLLTMIRTGNGRKSHRGLVVSCHVPGAYFVRQTRFVIKPGWQMLAGLR
ncbi:E3 ubiquitin-protein ligase RNF31-like, partial [Notechis scutatus]|uniref:E3 ubiquitin-protein ligase RNF31-like n=1 Tax=Notechis scutatus TaxID=8663 RepID=A0A6J1W4I7_9SAUR